MARGRHVVENSAHGCFSAARFISRSGGIPAVAVSLSRRPFRPANAGRFDVIDALIGTLPFSKKRFPSRASWLRARWGSIASTKSSRRDAASDGRPHRKANWPPAPFIGSSIGAPGRLGNIRSPLRSSESSEFRRAACVRDEWHPRNRRWCSPMASPARRQALLDAGRPAEHVAKKRSPSSACGCAKGSQGWGQIIRKSGRVPAVCSFSWHNDTRQKIVERSGVRHGDFVPVVPQFDPTSFPSFFRRALGHSELLEGFGMAVIEQMAAGLPTIAFDAPGPATSCETPARVARRSRDVAQFSEAVADIFERGPARYQELRRAKQTSALRFSWPTIARTPRAYRAHLHDVVRPRTVLQIVPHQPARSMASRLRAQSCQRGSPPATESPQRSSLPENIRHLQDGYAVISV